VELARAEALAELAEAAATSERDLADATGSDLQSLCCPRRAVSNCVSVVFGPADLLAEHGERER